MPDKAVSPTPDVLLKAKRKPDVVIVPARHVIALRGAGSPDAPAFAAAVGALYGIAYAMRFARKKTDLPVFKVGTLEGVWWAEGDDLPTDRVPDREDWRWQVRITMPGDATGEEVAAAVTAVTARRGGKLENSSEARAVELLALDESRCARVLHVGPYADEPATFILIDEMLAGQGMRRGDRHVEVYLSDPARTPPEKLRTVLLAPLLKE